MEFYDGFNISTPASGDTYSSAERTFRLNSLYQPDPTNSVRPLGFSTLAGIYARYRVDKVRIQIKAHSAGDEAWIVAAIVGPSSTVSTNAVSTTVAGANPLMAQMMIEKAANGTPQSYVTIEKEFSIAQLVGLTNKEYEAQWDRYTGTDTTNPTAGFIPYLLINAANRGLTASINVAFAVRLVFDCTWFERDVLLA